MKNNSYDESYAGNIGFMEMVHFWEKATPQEASAMKVIVQQKNWNAFRELIKKVLGKDLFKDEVTDVGWKGYEVTHPEVYQLFRRLHPQVFGSCMDSWIKGYLGEIDRFSEPSSSAAQWYKKGKNYKKRGTEDSFFKDERLRSPIGGVSVKGNFYPGGQFIPSSEDQEAAKKAIAEKEKENEQSGSKETGKEEKKIEKLPEEKELVEFLNTKTRKTLNLMDESYEDWASGACGEFAFALKDWLGEDASLVNVKNKNGVSMHLAVKYGDVLIDGNGIHKSKDDLLKKVDMVGGSLEDVKWDDYKNHVSQGVAKQLSQKLSEEFDGKTKQSEPKKKKSKGDVKIPVEKFTKFKCSATKHITKEGTFTPERQKLHDNLIKKTLSDVKPSKNPEFIMLGGGTASGKSTVKKTLPQLMEKGAYANLDSDEYKKELVPELIEKKDIRWAAYSHEESSYVTQRTMQAAFEESKPFILDGTGNTTVEKVSGMIENAKSRGFKVKGIYSTISIEEALRREEKRSQDIEREMGRKVPKSIVIEKHKLVSELFPKIVPLFDSISLYDTQVTQGEKPKLILSGEKGKLKIHDEKLYKAFLDKAKFTSDADEEVVPFDRKEEILIAIAQGEDITKTEGEKKYYNKLLPEVTEIRKAGLVVNIPFEIPSIEKEQNLKAKIKEEFTNLKKMFDSVEEEEQEDELDSGYFAAGTGFPPDDIEDEVYEEMKQVALENEGDIGLLFEDEKTKDSKSIFKQILDELTFLKRRFGASTNTTDEQLRSPEGGVSIKGQFYPGGQFIPNEVDQEEARKAIKKKEEENEKEKGTKKEEKESKKEPEGKVEEKKKFRSQSPPKKEYTPEQIAKREEVSKKRGEWKEKATGTIVGVKGEELEKELSSCKVRREEAKTFWKSIDADIDDGKKIEDGGYSPNDLLVKAMNNEEFMKKPMMEKVSLVSEMQRKQLKNAYNDKASIKQNEKQESALVYGTDTVRGCLNNCISCYACSLAGGITQIKFDTPVAAKLTGSPLKSKTELEKQKSVFEKKGDREKVEHIEKQLKEMEKLGIDHTILRIGVVGDPATDWKHTVDEIKSKLKGNKDLYGNILYVSKLQRIDGFDPEVIKSMHVSIDPFNSKHMNTTMENVKKLKKMNPDINITLRIRSFDSNNKELSDNLQKAVQFANDNDLPVLETKMRYTRQVAKLLEMNESSYHDTDGVNIKANHNFLGKKGHDANQGKMREFTDRKMVANKHVECDPTLKGCQSCGNCVRTTLNKNLPWQVNRT